MPDPNPSERLAEIEARVEAATSAPWGWQALETAYPMAQVIAGPSYGPRPQWRSHDYQAEQAQLDARFIAHAREDIPWLLEREKKLREENENLHVAHRMHREAHRDTGGGVEGCPVCFPALADSGEASGEAS